jgi:L-lysine exporter family protein LysE/ArgO
VAPFVHAFVTGFLLSLSVCLDLGLVNVAILRTAMRDGARPAFLVGLGSCFGDLIYFALSALGVSALLSWMPVRWTLWLGGTSVLLYLTGKMAREVVRPHALDLDAAPPAAMGAPPPAGAMAASPPRRPLFHPVFHPLFHSFFLGLSLALASPTSILWFAAVGGSVIASFAGQRRVLPPFVAGFFVAGVLWSFAIAFGAARVGRAAGVGAVRILSALSAVLFAYFALDVFRAGLRALW